MTKLSVIVPLFNEEAVIPLFFNRLHQTLNQIGQEYEIICIDDGSNDRTADLVIEQLEKNSFVKLIRFSRNFGHQAAITAGIDHAQGEVLVIIDGDLQDPPETIIDFWQKYLEGYDVVYAVRKKRKESIGKRLAYSIYYRFIKLIASDKFNLPLDSGDFSLISKKVADVLKAMPERNRYVRGLRSFAGFKQIGLPYERAERSLGHSKYTLFKLIKLAYDGIFSFSYFPITAVSLLGFIFSLVSFVGIIIVFWFRLFTEKSIPGFASTAIIILFFGGLQMLSLGILGEYIRRIYDETKKRPLYIIAEKIESN